MSGDKKRFVFDIDGVIATITPGNDYRLAQPMVETVELINELYRAGHRIILFTARGGTSGIDWSELTKQQMEEWGVLHHELRMGKPAGDYYIDDKMVGLDEVKRLFSS